MSREITSSLDDTGTLAYIHESRRWHYFLRRYSHSMKGTILWIMLNPSTADAVKDDATIRKIKGYSSSWGFSEMLVGNLFALRSTNPRLLWATEDFVERCGPDNMQWLTAMMDRADRIVLAWGNEVNNAPKRIKDIILAHATFVEQLAKGSGKPTFALGFTKNGNPVHPLYQPSDVELKAVT